MKALRSLVGGMKALFDKRRRNSDIDEELQSYMDAAVEEKMRNGMDKERALRVVRADVGSVEVVKHRIWSAGWEAAAESLWSDLRYTVRRLSRSPGLVLTVVLSIGLGIAANATIFSIVSRILLQPPPVGDPGTLTTLYQTHDGDACCNDFSEPAYKDVRDQTKSFSAVAAYYELVPASISGSGEPERVWGQSVTANYFDVTALRMALGRGFTSEQEHLPVVVLGYGLWQRRFGGDRAIVGKPISLSGHVYSVVGVAPRGYRGLDLVLDPQFWVPLGDLPLLIPNPPDANSRDFHWFRVAARMRPGVTQAQVIAELKVLAQSLARAHPESDKGNGFQLVKAGQLPPGGPFATAPVFLAALSVVVLLVLCIACANVANLLLALTASRQKEMGVRLALGATRVQLLRQMLMESVLLALGGGLLGVVLSVWSTSALSAFRLPAPIPLDLSVSVDWRVVLYSFLLSVVAGVAFGFAPSWKASRPVLSSALKGEDSLARPGRRFSLRDVLVVAQISLSLVLLCATGLFLRSLQSAANIDIGFRSRGLLMMAVDPQAHGYTAARTTQLLTQLRQRVASLPGVNSVATTDIVPLSMGGRRDGFVAEGRPAPTVDMGTELYMISPDYFETMGIPRIAGRALGDENPDAPKVAVVNEEFAQRLFKHDSPIGQRVTGGGVTYEIVGVVGNIKSRTLGEELRPVLYRSINQNIAGDPSFNGYSLMVRYAGDPPALSAAIRHEIGALDPSLAVFNTQTIEEHLHDALFLPRLAGTLFGVFGFIGILLATVGLYGVMSYTVSRRTHEIGIRIALGAQAGAAQKLIVTQGMRLTLIAIALGLPLAFAASKLSASILYGVRPHDVVTFTTIPVIFLVAALLACWIPSRRASRVDPMKTLRCDG
jgi:predicted permease